MEDRQFENRDDWYEHELQNHRIEWCCNLEDHAPYTSRSEFMLHLQEHNSSLQSSPEPLNIIQQFQKPIQKRLNICPLCSKPSENIKHHVSRHMEQLALYVLGGNNQQDSGAGSNASNSARRVSSSADLNSDDGSAGSEYQPSETSDFISLQDDILGEQLTVPDTTEAPWTILFNVSGTLSLTGTIIAFLNLASHLTKMQLLYPKFIPSSLTGKEILKDNFSGLQSMLYQLDKRIKEKNTLGCLSQIEKNLGDISDQASDLCRDLAKYSKEFDGTSKVNLQKSIANFRSRLTPMLRKEFNIKIHDLRRRLKLDILLPFSENIYALDLIILERIWDDSSVAGELFDVLNKYGPESLLGSLPNEPNPPLEPPPFSLLFSVTDLSLNDEIESRYEMETNQWLPPIESRGFHNLPMKSQVLYRYQDFAELSQVNNYVWRDGNWYGNGNTPSLTVYRAMSIFWCNPIFLTSTCDPTIYNMVDMDEPHNRWWPLTFDLNGSTAIVQESAERWFLRGSGNRWVMDFGLGGYLRHLDSKHTSELGGNIGTIIGLIALSCPAGQLSNALLIDKAWHNGYWHGHQQGPGITQEPRGVVVTIYLDDENPISTKETLNAIESIGGPLVRAFD